MGLERRGNNYYYYEKQRNGKNVSSVYSGKGEIAIILHQMKLWKKDEDDYEKQRKNNEREQELNTQKELDSILDSISEYADCLTDAFYLTNGFHQHKRQWRRKRNENER